MPKTNTCPECHQDGRETLEILDALGHKVHAEDDDRDDDHLNQDKPAG